MDPIRFIIYYFLSWQNSVQFFVRILGTLTLWKSMFYVISLDLIIFMLMRIFHHWNDILSFLICNLQLLSVRTQRTIVESNTSQVHSSYTIRGSSLHVPSNSTWMRNIIADSDRLSIADSASFIFIAALRLIYTRINALLHECRS